MGVYAWGYMYACVHAPQDLLAALLSLSAYIQISGYLDTSLYMGGCICMFVCVHAWPRSTCIRRALMMAVQTVLCHGCTRTAPLGHPESSLSEEASYCWTRVLACPQAMFVILSFGSFVTGSKCISM